MWLLSTDRAELHFFPSPDSVVPGYAILSHVWDATEQTLQETQALRTAGDPKEGYNPRDHSSPKVREACILAERLGYRWLWDDTCCIDKTSSSELSEAINSMFLYYSSAEVCFAYLADVDPKWNPSIRAFSESRWFQRGWTLQELIAPDQVIFLSLDWTPIGTKAELATTLARITHIPPAVLTFEEDVKDMSIAERMSWAAMRRTTRLEDEAYCLMGIFGVHMPTIYGEGENAFRRLQEEIMRKSPDASLFAWGPIKYDLPVLSSGSSMNCDEPATYLLATSPLCFDSTSGLVFGSRCKPGASSNLNKVRWTVPAPSTCLPWISPIPSFEITPHGVSARMPVVQVGGYSIASLATYTRLGEPLGLLLERCPMGTDRDRPLYHCCVPGPGVETPYRLVNILSVLHKFPEIQAQLDNPRWCQLFLAYICPRPWGSPVPSIFNIRGMTPFYVPGWLRRALGVQAKASVSTLPEPMHLPWNGEHPVEIGVDRGTHSFCMRLGRCTYSAGQGQHWATIFFDRRSFGIAMPLSHDCSRDHIETWPLRKRTYSLEFFRTWERGRETILLSFAPRPVSTTVRAYALTELLWMDCGRVLFSSLHFSRPAS